MFGGKADAKALSVVTSAEVFLSPSVLKTGTLPNKPNGALTRDTLMKSDSEEIFQQKEQHHPPQWRRVRRNRSLGNPRNAIILEGSYTI